ncbi:hypothetical protein HYQ46_012171 [Verticillium longisporum]|nr:hypothetical protein HYQ46_012171 [Verticillium longisporum]
MPVAPLIQHLAMPPILMPSPPKTINFGSSIKSNVKTEGCRMWIESPESVIDQIFQVCALIINFEDTERRFLRDFVIAIGARILLLAAKIMASDPNPSSESAAAAPAVDTTMDGASNGTDSAPRAAQPTTGETGSPAPAEGGARGQERGNDKKQQQQGKKNKQGGRNEWR